MRGGTAIVSGFGFGNGSDSDCVAHSTRLWRTTIGAELTTDMIDLWGRREQRLEIEGNVRGEFGRTGEKERG